MTTTSMIRVLVVDDHDDSRELLASLLELRGYTVQMAADGPEALATAATFLPTVAVLDIGLPGADGYEVARLLRLMPELGALRIVALSGYGNASDRQRSVDAGIDAHIVKPADIASLVSAFSK